MTHMFCLSMLLPGKIGKVVRRIAFATGSIEIIYLIIWGYILRSIKFDVLRQVYENNFLCVDFKVVNPSFATVEIVKIYVYDSNNNKVDKKSKDLPKLIDGNDEKTFRLNFILLSTNF